MLKVAIMISCSVFTFTMFFLVPTISIAGALSGYWDGHVIQNSPLMSYPMEMRLSNNYGTINYHSLGCGGSLEFIKTDGAGFWFRERITFGRDKCIDGGIVEIRRQNYNDNANWLWRWEDRGVSALGIVQGKGITEL